MSDINKLISSLPSSPHASFKFTNVTHSVREFLHHNNALYRHDNINHLDSFFVYRYFSFACIHFIRIKLHCTRFRPFTFRLSKAGDYRLRLLSFNLFLFFRLNTRPSPRVREYILYCPNKFCLFSLLLKAVVWMQRKIKKTFFSLNFFFQFFFPVEIVAWICIERMREK